MLALKAIFKFRAHVGIGKEKKVSAGPEYAEAFKAVQLTRVKNQCEN